MTMAITEVDVDLDIAPTCEYSHHPDINTVDLPAEYFVRVKCPGCPPVYRILSCVNCWHTVQKVVITCEDCGYSGFGSEFWIMLSKL
jgi:predicted RNA-binding Zn-ribbon protein involved in translation (DUF1610 family)